MVIRDARFVMSNTRVELCPGGTLPEYAFIGRSNVGKSSLINMLTGRSALAKTSSLPGKTQLINHFLINDEWYLVDLPGYGYARVSKESREKWGKMIRGYLAKRETLTCLFVLIDSRLPPQAVDLEFINMVGEMGVPFALVFTKADKQSNSRTRQNVEVFLEKMRESWDELPTWFISSAVAREGRDDLLNFIDGVNRQVKEAGRNA
ncbi:ribosome biogenesis GTP-binding protein YihA/YsxC [Hymenobacter latericus]|uniref:ribosome biogenesis GTP-binding protein YihA/YsxC n=1 Tax=Hymenobacter sp. YIM 151858-1 TaxID=2987688 RepID=UPI002226C839|nr:ribosome biogenesis GTP-binding protein YihA/YsxC [Hymenobacter sp. YIM 151858-1]UYZ60452.1 ribosome biogenesis GTP-binding protein YihA/YsxC [Hymenobacter sp. YIM 151858-1]